MTGAREINIYPGVKEVCYLIFSGQDVGWFGY
jgi:hypothetical protein